MEKHMGYLTFQTVDAERMEKIRLSSIYGKYDLPEQCRGGKHCKHRGD